MKILIVICYFYSLIEINSIDTENTVRDASNSSFLYSLTSGEFYNKYRLPLVFYDRTDRENEYLENKKNNELTMIDLIQKELEDEKYFKSKCSFPDFSLYREITNAYISKSYLNWDSCSALQKKKKQMEIMGQSKSIPYYIQSVKENWKKYTIDGLDSVTPLPPPKIISSEMAPGVERYAKEYHSLLLSIIIKNSYLNSNVNLNSEESSYPGISWVNSFINDFDEMFYKNNVSALNLNQRIQFEKVVLSNSNISNKLHYLLRNPILKGFPAKTQTQENKIIFEEFKKSTNLMTARMIGMDEEKNKLKSIIECFETWPTWHWDNLRMAYYYGFYNEYGREYYFSNELKQNTELWALVHAINKKIYSSEVFQKRLNSLYSDCKTVKLKTKKEIDELLKREEEAHRDSLRKGY